MGEGHAHRGAVNSVAFSPDAALCATAGADHALCLWDTEGPMAEKLFAIPNRVKQRNDFEIAIPHLGSVILTRSGNGTVAGTIILPDFFVAWAGKDGYHTANVVQ